MRTREGSSTYPFRSQPRHAREAGAAVAPEEGVIGDEVGEGAGEENEAAEDAEDIEDGDAGVGAGAGLSGGG